MEETTYLVIDGENIDATLGLSVLDHRPAPEERPRWDRVLTTAAQIWDQPTKGLFFLNGSNGYLPMSFIQALTAMNYQPIPLSAPSTIKVVDVGIQRTLDAIAHSPSGSVMLGSHDADFVPQLRTLLEMGRKVAVVGFREFMSSQLHELESLGLEILDLEYDVHAFQVHLPRIHIIDLDDFNPYDYL